MTRKPREDRNSIVDITLTLRLTREDRMLLDELVQRRARQARRDGMEVTAASFVRALIRKEAEAQGLHVGSFAESPIESSRRMSETNGGE